MILKSLLQTVNSLALASTIQAEAPPTKTGVFLYNTTNRTRAQSKTRKSRRAMQKLSRRKNRKP